MKDRGTTRSTGAILGQKGSRRAAIQGHHHVRTSPQVHCELGHAAPNVDPFGRPAMAMLEASDLEKHLYDVQSTPQVVKI